MEVFVGGIVSDMANKSTVSKNNPDVDKGTYVLPSSFELVPAASNSRTRWASSFESVKLRLCSSLALMICWTIVLKTCCGIGFDSRDCEISLLLWQVSILFLSNSRSMMVVDGNV